MITYRIPITGYKESTNKIYAGVHWAKRKQFKDSILALAGWHCRPIQRVESYPVQILYKFVFGSKPLDSTNCSYLIKCFEDALVAFEIIKDDSPEYVARTIIEVVALPKQKNKKNVGHMGQEKVEKNEDWLEIQITNA